VLIDDEEDGCKAHDETNNAAVLVEVVAMQKIVQEIFSSGVLCS
jgi:hypothetical protein